MKELLNLEIWQAGVLCVWPDEGRVRMPKVWESPRLAWFRPIHDALCSARHAVEGMLVRLAFGQRDF